MYEKCIINIPNYIFKNITIIKMKFNLNQSCKAQKV